MKIVKLTDSVAVSAQISPEDIPQIAACGYRVLINNRPDGEEAGQPGGAALAAAARAAGMEYRYMPVTAPDFPGADFDSLCALFGDSTRPVLAFWRSGTRCANLWVASVAAEQRQDAMRTASQCGFELTMVARHLGQTR